MFSAKIIALTLAGAALPVVAASEASARVALPEAPSALIQLIDDDDDDRRDRYWSKRGFRDRYDHDRDWDDDRDDDDDDDDDDRRRGWRRG